MPVKFSGGLIAVFLFLLSFCSCQKSAAIKELKLKGLTVQLNKLPDSGESDDSYGARLIPDKVLSAKITGAIKTGLMYRMDSCFYLQAGQTKVFADLVQPVANGLKGTYEYLITFQKEKTPPGETRLVYQDKYLNRATFVFGPR